jgi:uncharacterized protein
VDFMALDWPLYLQSLAGGALIGVSAALFLLLDGRIAGISGIVGGLLGSRTTMTATNLAFVLGLLLGPSLFRILIGHEPVVRINSPWPLLAAGGVLVGFGTRLGSGCTSGHGVCGLARFSRRSIAATGVFMTTAIATVFLVRHVLLGGGA